MSTRVVLICFDNPYLPPAEGGKKVMRSHIESLASLAVELDVFVFSKRSERGVEVPSSPPAHVTVHEYEMARGWRAVFSRYPLCSVRRVVAGARSDLHGVTYDLAFYEGEQVAPYRLEDLVSAKRHALFFHDIESEYRRQHARAERSIAKKLAQLVESWKFRAIEPRLQSWFDDLLFISIDEKDRFAPCEGIYFPYTVANIAQHPVGSAEGPILYVGDLTIEGNFKSMLWFCSEVLPALPVPASGGCTIRVIGRISDQSRKLLEDCGVPGSVEVLGYVDDLDTEYQRASMVIAPVHYGAGVKIKTLDALAHGQILLATPKATEGTRLVSGVHLVVLEEANDWISMCLEIRNNRSGFESLSSSALQLLRSEHSERRQRAAFSSLLRQSQPDPGF